MEDAVDDDPVQFVFVGLVEEFGIAAHRIKRDDEVAVEYIPLVIVEGDDVRVIIVS